MQQGDLVWYRQAVRGGYGWQHQRIPAVFIRRAGTRITVEVLLRHGGRKRIQVHPKNVSARAAGEAIEWSR